MSDLLVALYTIEPAEPYLAVLKQQGILIRRAFAAEGRFISGWISERFEPSWAEAPRVTSIRQPSSCWIAIELEQAHSPQDAYDMPEQKLLGFACYDAGIKGMFGPFGVREDRRSQGIGKALLLQTLHAMYEEHYAYAVIGWAGPVDWYVRTTGATLIPNSEPGPFQGQLVS